MDNHPEDTLDTPRRTYLHSPAPTSSFSAWCPWLRATRFHRAWCGTYLTAVQCILYRLYIYYCSVNCWLISPSVDLHPPSPPRLKSLTHVASVITRLWLCVGLPSNQLWLLFRSMPIFEFSTPHFGCGFLREQTSNWVDIKFGELICYSPYRHAIHFLRNLLRFNKVRMMQESVGLIFERLINLGFRFFFAAGGGLSSFLKFDQGTYVGLV